MLTLSLSGLSRNARFKFDVNAPIWIEPPIDTPSATPSVRTVYSSAVALGMDRLSTAEMSATVMRDGLKERVIRLTELTAQEHRVPQRSREESQVVSPPWPAGCPLDSDERGSDGWDEGDDAEHAVAAPFADVAAVSRVPVP